MDNEGLPAQDAGDSITSYQVAAQSQAAVEAMETDFAGELASLETEDLTNARDAGSSTENFQEAAPRRTILKTAVVVEFVEDGVENGQIDALAAGETTRDYPEDAQLPVEVAVAKLQSVEK